MSQPTKTPFYVRQAYRRLSRRVLTSPTQKNYHLDRIRIALKFSENEPLQAALADYFFGCWYDIPFEGQSILDETKERLSDSVYQSFFKCLNKQDYISTISLLANRWSVLITPSLDVPIHQIRTSSDNAWHVADDITELLIKARNNNNPELAQIEDEFLEHCLVCKDRMAFMLVWFRLNKADWHFDDRWFACQASLENNAS